MDAMRGDIQNLVSLGGLSLVLHRDRRTSSATIDRVRSAEMVEGKYAAVRTRLNVYANRYFLLT